jgi:hypothetical protein
MRGHRVDLTKEGNVSKELWIDEFDRLYNEACDRGVSPTVAYMQATEAVDRAYADRVADRIDLARLMKKEGHL